MITFKTLKEAAPAQATPAQAAPAQAAPAQAAPAQAAPAQPDQKQVLQQATEAIKQIVMPIVTQTLNDYFQKTFPGILQAALKGQSPAAPSPAAPAQKPAAGGQKPAAAPAAAPKA